MTFTQAIALIDTLMLEHGPIADPRLGEIRGYLHRLHDELITGHRFAWKKIGQLERRIGKARRLLRSNKSSTGTAGGLALLVLQNLRLSRGRR